MEGEGGNGIFDQTTRDLNERLHDISNAKVGQVRLLYVVVDTGVDTDADVVWVVYVIPLVIRR